MQTTAKWFTLAVAAISLMPTVAAAELGEAVAARKTTAARLPALEAPAS